MLAAPSASPTRSSGSTPGGRGAAEGCGRGQAAAARARRLASPRLAQGRVELCDGEVDVGIRVRAGDEPRLEGRGREEHTPGERRAMPPRKQARVRTLRLRERAHRPRGEIDAPHRAGVTPDRKSTRLNSSHSQISYAVFCLKKKRDLLQRERDARRPRVSRFSLNLRLLSQDPPQLDV